KLAPVVELTGAGNEGNRPCGHTLAHAQYDTPLRYATAASRRRRQPTRCSERSATRFDWNIDVNTVDAVGGLSGALFIWIEASVETASSMPPSSARKISAASIRMM